jgi:hypothetical protein
MADNNDKHRVLDSYFEETASSSPIHHFVKKDSMPSLLLGRASASLQVPVISFEPWSGLRVVLDPPRRLLLLDGVQLDMRDQVVGPRLKLLNAARTAVHLLWSVLGVRPGEGQRSAGKRKLNVQEPDSLLVMPLQMLVPLVLLVDPRAVRVRARVLSPFVDLDGHPIDVDLHVPLVAAVAPLVSR